MADDGEGEFDGDGDDDNTPPSGGGDDKASDKKSGEVVSLDKFRKK